MNGMYWGLLGPDTVARVRRTRTLGVGAAVRFFNEQAVPGLGGVWYGKQLWYAMMGVALAEKLEQTGKKVSKIACANAIEALACWFALDGNGWMAEPRLRGATKLKGAKDLSFKNVSRAGFYVTQPMRMATVQALPALGLVQADATRFNQFKLSDSSLLKFYLGDTSAGGYGREVFEEVCEWGQGRLDVMEKTKKTKKLGHALSPLVSMDETPCRLFRDVLVNGGGIEPHINKRRRRTALQWVEALRQQPEQMLDWQVCPAMLEKDHWQELQAGAAFFRLQDQSLLVLDALETHLAGLSDSRSFDLSKSALPLPVLAALETLRQRAKGYSAFKHDQPDARQFCDECLADSDLAVIRNLVARDERVLRLMGELVLPGPAFDPSPRDNLVAEAATDVVDQRRVKWPPDISHRIGNLFFLNADLHGDLPSWLGEVPQTDGEAA